MSYHQFIANPNKQRQLVIPDIHGCLDTLQALLKKIDLQKNDQLFFLGDYIHRGKNSVGVLDLLMSLQANGYQIFPLSGNHEQIFLERRSFAVNESHIQFLKKLPYYYELDHFFLVHAGFDLATSKPFEDTEAMLWIRDFSLNAQKRDHVFRGKTVIIGHNPTFLEYIVEDIETKKPSICLDNGCIYTNKYDMGNLLCLDLTNWQLTIQENIE